MRLLLDTCTLIWILTGERPIPGRARSEIAVRDVLVSAACAWEIAIKFSKGTLRLPDAPDRLLPAVRARYGFESLPISEESALHTIKLPPLHADPFDRMLVAQAIVHGLTIVTPDPLVTQYPARTLW